jgi:hypothetical protein
MAVTRSLLKSMGLTDEQVATIIDAHTETVEGLKADRDKFKADSEKLTKVQAELDNLKGGEDWKGKYESKEKELKDYKASVEAKEKESAVKAAYRELLVGEHVGERQLDAVLGVTDFKDMKLDKDGKLENADALKEAIKQKWGGFITNETHKGAPVPTPPAVNPSGANSRAAELAKRFHEQRYGATPTPTPNPQT